MMRKTWAISLFLTLVAIGGLSSWSLWAQQTGEASYTFSRAPYLQMSAPDAMTIVWRTTGSVTPVVRYGPKPDQLDQTVPAASIVTRVSPEQAGTTPKLHSAPANTFQYEARVTGLKPLTTYYYAVYDGTTRLAGGDETYRFTTHPPHGTEQPLRFWVVGDSGTGGKDQDLVHQGMLDYVKADGRRPDLYLHVGDMAYGEGTDRQFQNNFFKMYEPTLRNMICWASMGNHEGNTSKGATGIGPYYDSYVCPTRAEGGGLASGTEAFYSFDYGKVHFICLDSHDLDRRPTGAMAQWLKADMEKTKAAWQVAFFHHPPYTKGSHDSDTERDLIEMRQYIMPILESGGVDLVLTGHSHIYERSMLMDGAYATPTVAENVIFDDGDGNPEGEGAYKKSEGIHPNNGTIQVVAGHGGTGLGLKANMSVFKVVIKEHGSVLIDVKGDTLTGIMVDKQAKRRDLFSLVKRGTVVQKRIANPRQLPPLKQEVAVTNKAIPMAANVTLPPKAIKLIDQHDEWEYLAGSHPKPDWIQFTFDTETWKKGRAGFGFADDDDRTVLADMRNKYTVVYARLEFPQIRDPMQEFGLVVNYDDAFIAYINGHEVLRVGVGQGAGATARNIKDHEAAGYEYFPLKDVAKYLRPNDENVLCIEGHNNSRTSTDFTLDPYLIAVPKEAAK